MKKKVYLNEEKFASLLFYIGVFISGLTISSKAFGWDDMAIGFAILTAVYIVVAVIGFYYVPTKKVNNKEEK